MNPVTLNVFDNNSDTNKDAVVSDIEEPVPSTNTTSAVPEVEYKRLSSRLFGFDVARLLAMIMMVHGHTVYALISHSILYSGTTFWNY